MRTAPTPDDDSDSDSEPYATTDHYYDADILKPEKQQQQRNVGEPMERGTLPKLKLKGLALRWATGEKKGEVATLKDEDPGRQHGEFPLNFHLILFYCYIRPCGVTLKLRPRTVLPTKRPRGVNLSATRSMRSSLEPLLFLRHSFRPLDWLSL
jgi:hypothetical protein